MYHNSLLCNCRLVTLMGLLLHFLPTWAIFTPVDQGLYPDNMTMVIQLKYDGQVVDTCEVAAFIGGECRGVARTSDGLYYLLIAGEGSGQKVEIRTVVSGDVVAIDDSIVYSNDLNIGLPWEPYVIDITAIIRLKGDVNGDRSVDVADIATLISVMASDATLGSVAHYADVNGDGTVDVADIAAVISVMAANARMLEEM